MITILSYFAVFTAGAITARWRPLSRSARLQRQYNRRVRLIETEVRKTDEAMRRIVLDSWRWSS